MTRRKFRLAAAAVSAVAIGALGVSANAFADPGDPYVVGGTNQEAPNRALVNPTATTQLTIHKYAGLPTGNLNDGTEQTITGRTPLAGADFAIYRVPDVNLATNAGWEAAARYYEAETLNTAGMNPVATVTTDAAGLATATFPNGVGLYYVIETAAPAGYTRAAPFFVTLPMTTPSGAGEETRWMYDVNVYPKNQLDNIEKTITDRGVVTAENGIVYGAAARHTMTYTIRSSITDGTGPLGTYVIYDDLDPTMSLLAGSIALSDGTEFVRGVDYNAFVAPDPSQPFTAYPPSTRASGGPVVAVVVTAAGRAKLEANRSLDVVTTMTVEVAAKDADGIVPNRATFIPNQTWWQQNSTANPAFEPNNPTGSALGIDFLPGVPSQQTVSKFGDLVVTKVDPADATATMSGAVFDIYRDANNDQRCAPTEMIADNLIATTPATTAAGITRFRGLQASDFYNNAVQTNLITYCLVETVAPNGYNLNAEPFPFTILNGGGAVLAPVPDTTQRVANERSNLANSLPLTGGGGVATISIIGLVLVGGGLAYYAVASRKRREQDA